MGRQEEVLRKKGWSEEEIQQAKAILIKHKEDPDSKFFKNFTLGIVLFMILLFSVIALIVIKPFLIIPNKYIVFLIIALIGTFIGVIVSMAIKDIDIIQKQKATMISYGFPVVTAGAGIFLIRTLQRTATVFATTNQYNAILIGLLYGFFALIPFKLFTWKKNKKEKKEEL
jgi:hypothetical protein